MPKKCIIQDCSHNVFTHGYCKNHSYLHYGSKLDSKLSVKPKKVKINNISDKQIELLAQYRALKQLKKDSMILSGHWVCGLTGKAFHKDYDPDWHHLLGRKGKIDGEPALTCSKYLIPCYHEAHMQWHELPIEKLMQLGWWAKFEERMKLYYPKVYQLILNKKNKL